MPVKKEQPKAKSQTEQPAAAVLAGSPAAAPTDAESLQWPNRRLSPDRRLLSERWRDWLAFSTTIIALMAVIVSLEASRATMSAVLDSAKENTQWAQYQSKSIKEYTYQVSKAELELRVVGTPGIPAEAAEKYRKLIKRYDEELKRYKDEKDEIMQEAIALGKAKEKSQKLSGGFNAALVFLLIAIVLSSIATMLRKKYIWYIGLSMLAGCLYFFINSF